jgi:hypothetical protein
VLALELGPCTAAMRHLFARMGITAMRRMAARLTVTTARVGSRVEYSSGPVPGSTATAGIGAMVVITATEVTTADTAVIMAAVATTDVVDTLVADRSLPRMEVMLAVARLEAR